jgi:small-conductance mechanosensitive channel
LTELPFWDPERQERVRKRIFKIKVILDLLSQVLRIAGMIIGGIGLALFLMNVFSFAPTGDFTLLMVLGFAMYLVGYILRKLVAVLFGETEFQYIGDDKQNREVDY